MDAGNVTAVRLSHVVHQRLMPQTSGYQSDVTVLIYGAISQAVCCTDKVNYVCTTSRMLISIEFFLFRVLDGISCIAPCEGFCI